MFDVAARSGKVKESSDNIGLEAPAFVKNINIVMAGVAAGTIAALPFLQRELGDICIITNPAKTGGLQPRRHIPTAREISVEANAYLVRLIARVPEKKLTYCNDLPCQQGDTSIMGGGQDDVRGRIP